MKKENGITLVALVISIIVLLILATVSVQVLTGDNGLLIKSRSAVDKYSEGEIEEQIKLAYTEWQTAKLTGTTENAKDFIKNRLNSSIGNVEDVSVDDNALTVTINKKDEEKTYYYNVKKGTVKQIELAKNSDDKNDSYVGCYADMDEDGIVDGVIFVDLLTGSIRDTQQWYNNNGKYTLPENVNVNNVKTYYISQNSYTDSKFGTHAVISPKGKNGEKRFYIMTLTDFTNSAYTDETDPSKNYPAYSSYYWYKNATGNMSNRTTSVNFGDGKTNTNSIMEKWNDSTFGTVENQDIWKHIQSLYTAGWFIPSRGEWAAFVNELGITDSNYNSTYGLSYEYWSSSQFTDSTAWIANLNENRITYGGVDYADPVRLATTF